MVIAVVTTGNCEGILLFSFFGPRQGSSTQGRNDMKIKGTRRESSMIHSARPTVSAVVNIVFVLLDFEKRGRTCENNDRTTSRDCGRPHG